MGNSNNSKVSDESLRQLLNECEFKLHDPKEDEISCTTSIYFESSLYKDYPQIVTDVLPDCISAAAEAEVQVEASELRNSDMVAFVIDCFQRKFPGRVFPEDTKRKLKK